MSWSNLPHADTSPSAAHKHSSGLLLKVNLWRSMNMSRFFLVGFFSAPEVLAQKPYSKAVDCWSIGVIAYIL